MLGVTGREKQMSQRNKTVLGNMKFPRRCCDGEGYKGGQNEVIMLSKGMSLIYFILLENVLFGCSHQIALLESEFESYEGDGIGDTLN